MMKTITFRADEDLIRRARERAAAEGTTLNEVFRRWLEGTLNGLERPPRMPSSWPAWTMFGRAVRLGGTR
jgi:hypothetical protein